MTDPDPPLQPPLDTARHRRYWRRCLRSLLPQPYTANDSTRMTLGCFAVAAVDLLADAADPVLLPDDRPRLRQWVLACQHPGGGFAGGPTHVFPGPHAPPPGEANLAATLFALQLLGLLAEDAGEDAFTGVNRVRTLRWLRRLQRPDGSFGEFVGDVLATPVIGGGADMRYCYMAAMVRWMLGPGPDPAHDIDVDALVAYIRQGQTYDGGFAQSATHEAHAGYAFCAVAALALLQRTAPATPSLLARGIADTPALLRWLSARAFVFREEDATSDDDDDPPESLTTTITPALTPDFTPPLLAFNGRANKHADTCYTWWTLGAMAILAEHGLPSTPPPWLPARRFLLEQTQHLIGGFSKTPGGPPDLYHAYLGLAALAVQGEPGLAPFDAAVCVSRAAVARIEAAREGLARSGGQAAVQRQASLLEMGRALSSVRRVKA